MKKITLTTSTKGISFSSLTNKSKRKVYKSISKRYRNNNISHGVKFDFNRDIPNMAAAFFEKNPYFFNFYKMEIWTN